MTDDKPIVDSDEFFAPSDEHPDLMDALGAIIELEVDKRIKMIAETLNQRLVEIHKTLAIEVIEIAIVKLAPDKADTVVFWLPQNFTTVQAEHAGAALKSVIDGKFRHMIFVKGGVELEVIKGNTILLPS